MNKEQAYAALINKDTSTLEDFVISKGFNELFNARESAVIQNGSEAYWDGSLVRLRASRLSPVSSGQENREYLQSTHPLHHWRTEYTDIFTRTRNDRAFVDCWINNTSQKMGFAYGIFPELCQGGLDDDTSKVIHLRNIRERYPPPSLKESLLGSTKNETFVNIYLNLFVGFFAWRVVGDEILHLPKEQLPLVSAAAIAGLQVLIYLPMSQIRGSGYYEHRGVKLDKAAIDQLLA